VELKLQRETSVGNTTPGQLFIDGEFFCYTVERLLSDPYHPAIRAGTYQVSVRGTYNTKLWTPYSNRWLPHIEGVSGRVGIEMHSGNSSQDSEGCVIVGYHRDSPDVITGGTTHPCLKDLIDRMLKALDAKEGITITVLDAA